MNEVFLIGKVLTDVEFKFMINSKRIAKARFNGKQIKCNKEELRKLKRNDFRIYADYVYKNINTQNMVMINGCIENNNVIIKKINTIS